MNRLAQYTMTAVFWLTLAVNTSNAQIVQQSPISQRIENNVETGITINQTINRKSLVSRRNRSSFNLGLAFTRAAYYASVADQDAESAERAILELAKLSARFDAQPEIQSALDLALKMVTHGTGTAQARWQIIVAAGDAQSRLLGVEPSWFYQTGVSAARLQIGNVARNEDSVRAELQKLEILFKVASDLVPSEMLQLVSSMTHLAENKSFTDFEYLIIDDRLGEFTRLVND